MCVTWPAISAWEWTSLVWKMMMCVRESKFYISDVAGLQWKFLALANCRASQPSSAPSAANKFCLAVSSQMA